MKKQLFNILEQFDIKGTVSSVDTFGEGFINDTFKVITEGRAWNYLLQRKNQNIFKNIPEMMGNIEKVTQHLKVKIQEKGGDIFREAMTLIKTHDGLLYYKDMGGEYWTLCIYIDDHICYDQANSFELAYAGGKGIGKFQAMLADFKKDLVDTLPGFHDIKFRFQQWDEVLKKDLVGRRSSLKKEISWIESRRDEMLLFWERVENGTIPKRVTHNDTKINNILFDHSGEVLCVIDLDTVLQSPILNDFGDAIRSYANTGLEDDRDLNNINLDINIFKAFSEGYYSEVKSFITKIELDHLAFSARFITFEQVLRFLMDHIAGDQYYKIKYPEHNLIRARAQNKLLENIEYYLPVMKETISQLAGK